MSRKNRNSQTNKKGTIIGFGVTAAVLSGIFGLNSLLGIAVIGGVAYVVGKVVGIMSSPLDTTTHNKEDKPQREIEQMAQQTTGDDSVDALIQRGQQILLQIRAENRAIPDQKLSQQMYQLESMCLSIFRTVAEQPAKAPQIRKFMNYYLPTTLKMLASYRTMQNRGVSRGELMNARNTLIRGMDMVLTACQKQIDNLYQSDMLDISTDIDVLEQMLRRDGFADGGLSNVPFEGTAFADPEAFRETLARTVVDLEKHAEPAPQPAADYQAVPVAPQEEIHQAPVMQAPRTAAAAQLGDQTRPTLFVDADGDGQDDFTSFYQQKNNKQ